MVGQKEIADFREDDGEEEEVDNQWRVKTGPEHITLLGIRD
jgi:hypothetical protein